jgi:hypothetical protein
MIRRLSTLLTFSLVVWSFSAKTQSTFSSVKSLFQTHCAIACHNGTDLSGNMDLTGTDQEVYSRIVNVDPANPAALAKGYKRIRPGYPDRSFLFRKCNTGLYPRDMLESSDQGAQMPGYPQAALNDQELELIRQWIYKGAPLTGNVVDQAIINEYYTAGGINSIPNPPPVLSDPSVIQLHLGRIFLAPQSETEYYIKYDLNLTEDVKVDRIELIMAPQSHHFIIYKFLPNSENLFNEGLRLQNPTTGSGSSGGYNTLVNAWQISYDTQLPEGTAYLWTAGSVLDLNYHMRNYSVDSVLAIEAYVNVYTKPATEPDEIMYSDLVPNISILIPNNNQPYTFSQKDNDPSATRNWNIWQLTSHTHKYGVDFDVFKVNSDGSEGEQIYEGFYNVDYSFPLGYYDFSHPPIMQFEPLETINPKLGLIQKATFKNNGPDWVFFGLTTNDEMMLYYIQYTLGDFISPNTLNELDQLDMTVYPNPGNGFINLGFESAMKKSILIELDDLTGRKLFSREYQIGSGHQEIQLDMNRISVPGVYLLRATTDRGSSVKRIVVE